MAMGGHAGAGQGKCGTDEVSSLDCEGPDSLPPRSPSTCPGPSNWPVGKLGHAGKALSGARGFAGEHCGYLRMVGGQGLPGHPQGVQERALGGKLVFGLTKGRSWTAEGSRPSKSCWDQGERISTRWEQVVPRPHKQFLLGPQPPLEYRGWAGSATHCSWRRLLR